MAGQLNLPLLEIDSDAPWNDDKLNRSQVAQTLTSIITGQEQPLVVSLSGGWGTGKTFMLQRWQKDLEKGGYVSIYFNAWEDDFCNDPFVAIIGQITEEIASHKEFKGVLGQVKKAAKKFIAYSSLKMMDKATGGLVGKDLIDSMKNKVLSEYENQRKAKKELKDSLMKMSAKVKEKSGNPLVFIVDELDRCRPTFAIELLERIKHIFDVPNIVFVVGINRDELCKSIKSVYGEIDASTYLQRFFHAELTMPGSLANVYIKYLLGKFGILHLFFPLVEEFENDEFLGFVSRRIHIKEKLSLRDLEHCIRYLHIIGNKADSRVPVLFLFIFIMVKMKRPELYKKWAAKQASNSEILDVIAELLDKDSRTEIARHLRGFERIPAEYFKLVEILG